MGVRVECTIDRPNRLRKEQLQRNLPCLQDIPIRGLRINRSRAGRQILRVCRDECGMRTSRAGTDLGEDIRIVGVDTLEDEGGVVGLIGVAFLVGGGRG